LKQRPLRRMGEQHGGCARNGRQAADIPKPRIARSMEMGRLFRLVVSG
jgi:hypothetical protein